MLQNFLARYVHGQDEAHLTNTTMYFFFMTYFVPIFFTFTLDGYALGSPSASEVYGILCRISSATGIRYFNGCSTR